MVSWRLGSSCITSSPVAVYLGCAAEQALLSGDSANPFLPAQLEC